MDNKQVLMSATKYGNNGKAHYTDILNMCDPSKQRVFIANFGHMTKAINKPLIVNNKLFSSVFGLLIMENYAYSHWTALVSVC